MSATIRDVAKLAGVAPSTVSRVLNKTAPISEETTNRIYQAMKELKYVPNDIARSFASGSSRAIAIAINVSDAPAYANSFFNNTVFGIETSAHKNGYNLIITGTNEKRGGIGSIEKLILSKKIDGLILPVSMLQPSIVTLVKDTRFPCVVLGRCSAISGKISWIDIANEQAGSDAVHHLQGRGYRKISFLTRSDRELFIRDRFTGYRAELERAGLVQLPAVVMGSGASVEEMRERIKNLLRSENAPDAVICADDRVALAALRAAKEMDIAVPGTLGILCFDNTEVTEFAETAISATEVDTFELGRLAAEMLLRRIENPGLAANHSEITTKVIARKSTDK